MAQCEEHKSNIRILELLIHQYLSNIFPEECHSVIHCLKFILLSEYIQSILKTAGQYDTIIHQLCQNVL
jgi:hypothetical protein